MYLFVISLRFIFVLSAYFRFILTSTCQILKMYKAHDFSCMNQVGFFSFRSFSTFDTLHRFLFLKISIPNNLQSFSYDKWYIRIKVIRNINQMVKVFHVFVFGRIFHFREMAYSHNLIYYPKAKVK